MSDKSKKVQRTKEVFAPERNNVEKIKEYYREKRANNEIPKPVAEVMETTELSRSNIGQYFQFKSGEEQQKCAEAYLAAAEAKKSVILAFPKQNLIRQADLMMEEQFGIHSQFNSIKKIYQKDDFQIFVVSVLSKKGYEIFSVRILLRGRNWSLDDEAFAFFSQIETAQNLNKPAVFKSKVFTLHPKTDLSNIQLMKSYSYEDLENECWLNDDYEEE